MTGTPAQSAGPRQSTPDTPPIPDTTPAGTTDATGPRQSTPDTPPIPDTTPAGTTDATGPRRPALDTPPVPDTAPAGTTDATGPRQSTPDTPPIPDTTPASTTDATGPRQSTPDTPPIPDTTPAGTTDATRPGTAEPDRFARSAPDRFAGSGPAAALPELRPRMLLPLYVHPLVDPAAWAELAEHPRARELTVVVNVHNGPGERLEEAYADVTMALAAAGVRQLGYVDLGYTDRPLADVLEDVTRWRGYPVDGVFFDQVPTDPLACGPVALAVRVARRAGLDSVVLNPGTVTDPLYYDLGVEICCFEGCWADYRGWSGEGGRPGDGHLVHGVPVLELTEAAQLLVARGAGFGLVTDLRRPLPYDGLPAWCVPAPPVLGG